MMERAEQRNKALKKASKIKSDRVKDREKMKNMAADQCIAYITDLLVTQPDTWCNATVKNFLGSIPGLSDARMRKILANKVSTSTIIRNLDPSQITLLLQNINKYAYIWIDANYRRRNTSQVV